MRSRRRLRRPVHLFVSLPIALMLGAILAGSAGPTSAQAATSTGARTTVVVDYFFHGVPEDDANQAASFANFTHPPAGSLTFDQSNMFDAAPVTQVGQNPNAESVPNPLAHWWTGPFSGPINGNIEFDWWWSQPNAASLPFGVEVNIKVVADPDFANPGVGTQTIIGNATATFTFADVQPQRFMTTVPVSCTVGVDCPTSELLIQVATLFVDTGPGLTALYDNAMFPSKFSVPGPSAATLLSFTGKAAGRTGVKLTWRTASEVDTVGFNVWRLTARGKTKVNRSLIPARGNAGGARYSFVDSTARPGVSYKYRLQVVNRSGSRAWYGSARVRMPR